VIGLIGAEVNRFTSRRLFRYIAVLAVAGIFAAALIAFIQSSKDPQASVQAAQREVESCREARTEFLNQNKGAEFDCPTVEQIVQQFDKRFRYAETMPDVTRGVAVTMFILSFVVAASFMGAEWGSGSMTTLLTWEPRRGRVLAAKVIAGAGLLALAAALLLALLNIVFIPVASLRGTTAGMSGSLWWTLAGIWLRGAGLAVFGAVVASGIATIARNTAGAIGVAFGYGIILDPLLGVIRRGRLRPWLLQHLLPRLLGFPVEVPQAGFNEPGVLPSLQQTLTAIRPVVVLTMYGAIVLAVAYAAFRARDVT
jgi:ABC-2 type transport system permease protein